MEDSLHRTIAPSDPAFLTFTSKPSREFESHPLRQHFSFGKMQSLNLNPHGLSLTQTSPSPSFLCFNFGDARFEPPP